MGKKLSSLKGKKIIDLYQKGYSQNLIAKMLHIDQSTVSKYVNRFKALKEQDGINAAIQEFAIEDQFEENHNVVAEFTKSDLTIADVKVALQVESILQECGIPHDQYKDFIQTFKKMKSSSYMDAAIKLNSLENKTGMGYQQIVTKADKAYLQLKKSQQELESINSKLAASKKKLAEIHQQEEQAAQSLKKHMQQIGVDEQRLKLIEPLNLALKKAKIPDQMLPAYMGRQESLNKAGISIDVFADIMDQCKVATMGDNGKHLLSLLKECGSLNEAIYKQQAKKELLEEEVSDLETQAKLKDKLEAELKKLEADKANLEADVAKIQKQQKDCIAQYEKQKNELNQLAGAYKSAQISYQELAKTKTHLEHEIKERQTVRDSMDNEITDKKQKLGNLGELESKHEQLTKGNAELESKVNAEKTRWEVFESFLGMVQSTSIEDLQKNAKTLLALITEIEPGKYSPEFLKDYILKDLAGPELQILKCTSCQARFSVDKKAPYGNYQCPIGGLSHVVVVDEDAGAILKGALAKVHQPIVVKRIKIKPSEPKDEGKA